MRVLPRVDGPVKRVDVVERLTRRRPAAGADAPSLCTRSLSVSVAAWVRGRR